MTNDRGHHSRTPMQPVDNTGAVPAVWIAVALCGLMAAVVLAVFGLPPADLHGVLHRLGVMDPLCGGTRSVYLTLHGR